MQPMRNIYLVIDCQNNKPKTPAQDYVLFLVNQIKKFFLLRGTLDFFDDAQGGGDRN